jgi:tetratricopeptide (TPR) repeat protein
VANHPYVGAYQDLLARTFLNLANLQKLTRQNPAAIASYEQARAGMEKLMAEYPLVVEYQHALASIYNNLGTLLHTTGKPDEAAKSYEQAQRLLERLVVEHPLVGEYQQLQANTFITQGIMQIQRKQPDAARASLDKARIIQEKLVAEHPEVTDYPLNLSGTYVNLGILLENNGKAQESVDWYAKAIAQLEALHERLPQHPTVKTFLRNAYWARAKAFDRMKQPSQALPDWDKAVALDSSPDRDYLRLLRAMSLAHAGRHAQAVVEAENLSRDKTAKGSTLYDLACVWSVAAAAVSHDLELPPSNRESLAEHHALRAMELDPSQNRGLFQESCKSRRSQQGPRSRSHSFASRVQKTAW